MGRNPFRVRVFGPLMPFRDGLAEELLRQGYTRQSSVRQVALLARIGRWLASKDLLPGEFTADRIAAFLDHRRRCGYKQYVSIEGLRPVVDYLRQLGVIPAEEREDPEQTPGNQLLEHYERYLINERSLCPAVVATYVGRAAHFLAATHNLRELNLHTLTPADVSSFVLDQVKGASPGYAKNKIAALRSFLRYLYILGELPCELSRAVPSVACWRLSGLPRSLTPGEISKLLSGPDRRTRVGRRDHAALLIMIRLGLRAAEVAALRLDDFDWARGELMVRGKSGRRDSLPIPADVGQAIAAYLQCGRPVSGSRTLFLAARAPHQMLTSDAIAQIARATGQRCGILHLGSHRLRHTVATQMLSSGSSLREIGQVLRHYSVETTAIYAKVDLSALRTICRPWPGEVR